MGEDLPSRRDFVADSMMTDLDAYKDFGGKSQDEVYQMLMTSILKYQLHFYDIGPKAFCFYLEPWLRYIQKQGYHPDDIDTFHRVCEFRLTWDTNIAAVRGCAAKITVALEEFASHVGPSVGADDARGLRVTAGEYRKLARSETHHGDD